MRIPAAEYSENQLQTKLSKILEGLHDAATKCQCKLVLPSIIPVFNNPSLHGRFLLPHPSVPPLSVHAQIGRFEADIAINE